MAEQRVETSLTYNTEKQENETEEEDEPPEEYFNKISVFAAKKFNQVLIKHQEQIEIMQEAITKALDR